MHEPRVAPLDLHRPRLVNQIFYRVMTGILRGFILRFFQLQPVNASIIPKRGAGIVLANHLALFDPIWVYAMLRRPVYFAATEDLFRKRALGQLIRWFGGVASDLFHR
jgi:1-acyl-sn-glycerol-3-phosphate acyltransferase